MLKEVSWMCIRKPFFKAASHGEHALPFSTGPDISCTPCLVRSSWKALLVWWRAHDKRAKQAVLLVEGAGGEKQGIRQAVGRRAFAERERPEAIDGDRWPVGGMKRAVMLELALPCKFRG